MKSLLYRCCLMFYRIRNCLTQLYAKDITPDYKQELDEALQREVRNSYKFKFRTKNMNKYRQRRNKTSLIVYLEPSM